MEASIEKGQLFTFYVETAGTTDVRLLIISFLITSHIIPCVRVHQAMSYELLSQITFALPEPQTLEAGFEEWIEKLQ